VTELVNHESRVGIERPPRDHVTTTTRWPGHSIRFQQAIHVAIAIRELDGAVATIPLTLIRPRS
jgi:hypothetical protein